MELPAKTPSLPVHDLLAFTALCQVVLYLWYTDRITGTLAASGFLGAFLFAGLVRAVREVFAESGLEPPGGQYPKATNDEATLVAQSEGMARVRYE